MVLLAAVVPGAILSAATLVGSGRAAAATTSVPTVTAVSPNSGPVGDGTGAAPITRESTSFPVSSESTGNSSIGVAPVKVGDLVVVSMQLHTAGVSISGISGGNVSSWKRAVTYTNTTTDILHYEVWWGVASATGASTATITYAGTGASQSPIELVADSYTTATPSTWSVVTSGGTSNPSSSSAQFPSLTSGTAADQLYWGVSEEESSGTSTPSAGFSSNDTANANCFLYDGGLAPSTTYAPTCGEYPADVSTAVGVIFAATASSASSGTAGTTVTVTGTEFSAGDTVHFGSSPAASVTVASPTTIDAVAPPGNPAVVGGTVDVTVTGPGGTSATSPADEFTYLVTSGAYSITLSTSTTSPGIGSTVTLTATANKDVGPTPYGMSIVDASTGTILSHVGSGSTFSVTVTQSTAITQRYVAEIDNAGGANIQANSVPVVVTWSGTAPAAPTVAGLNPSSGPAAGGTTVVVTGTNFAPGDSVHFGSTAASSVAVTSATSLTAVSPPGIGTVDVTVSGAGTTSATSAADRFTYTTPTTGGSGATYAEASGFPIYARGSGLASISVTPKAIGDLVVLVVELHSASAPTVTGLTSSNIAWQSSASAIDTDTVVPLHLEIWSGVATSTATATTTIAYSSSVSSNTIELIGDSFHFTGSGSWGLVQGGGTNGSSSTVALPSLTSAPGSAGGTGGGIYVGYSRVASSYAGGSTSGFTYYGTAMGNVELRGVSLAPSTTYAPTASQSSSAEFSSIGAIFADTGSASPPPARPTVSGLSPTSGPTVGGTKVTVTGTNFATGDTVDFGSTSATSVSVASSTSLSAVAPAGSGTVDVRVTGPGAGTSATSAADRFTYVVTAPARPTVTGVGPTSGPSAGGTKVTVTGTNLATGDAVDFGSSPAAAVTVTSPTSLSAVSPAGSGTVDVTVSGSGGPSATSAADRFTYVVTAPPAPTVTGLSPSSGPAAGGTTVTVSGTNFVAGDTVAFGPNAASSVTVTSPTALSAVAPAGTGTVDVTVKGSGTLSATSPADQFTYAAATTGGAPTYSEATGFPVYGRGAALSTVSLTPRAVGDLVVLVVELHSGTAPTVTGLTSSNVAWQSSASAIDNDPAVPLHLEIWAGVATSTTAATTTVDYSASVSSNTIELIGDSFHYSGSGTWRLIDGGGVNGSSSTVTFPSLTSASSSAGGGGGGIYVGYSRVASSYAGGSASGFTYYGTPMANVELRSVSLAPSTTYAPSAIQSASTEFSSIGAILAVQ